MIRLFFIILFLSVSSISGLHAQKKTTINRRIREAYKAIRTASGQENAERVLLDSMALPTTTDKIKAEVGSAEKGEAKGCTDACCSGHNH